VSHEIPLPGGNASGEVVRVGETVRKTWTSATPTVFAYLRELAAAGIEVPAPLGRDERGRQIVEFIPGRLAEELLPLRVDELRRVGAMVREIHDASESFAVAGPARPRNLIAPPGGDLMCHNDLAPWNLVVGDRWVFIDWDGSAPSTRLWDLAYAAQTFCLNDPGAVPDEAADRLAALVGGYRADLELRRELPRALGDRPAAMHAMLQEAHRAGTEPWATMFTSGHGAHWAEVTEYVRDHEDAWRSALTDDGRDSRPR
jgi:Ser/Thr protein kinase RdoA (MazF antagonist)